MFFKTRQLVAIQRQYSLTPRELQIVKLLADGIDSNEEIAKKLNISTHTAKIHLPTLPERIVRPVPFIALPQVTAGVFPENLKV